MAHLFFLILQWAAFQNLYASVACEEANRTLVRSAVETAVGPTPEEVFRTISQGNDGYIYIMRGVAPHEAKKAVEAGRNINGDDGRKRALQPHYGISNVAVKPAFVVKPNGDPQANNILWGTIYKNMCYYAQMGAALEHAGPENAHMGDLSYYSATKAILKTGQILVYRVKVGTPLSYHPESNTSPETRHLVIDTPADAELYAAFALPDTNPADGTPTSFPPTAKLI